MTNKELEKRIEEQKDRQDRLDKLYKQMNKNLIDLCRSVDKLTDDVEKLKSENKPTIWSTEPVTLPKPHEFKVGDRVQFKSWDEMGEEYGVVDDWRIDVSPKDTWAYFTIYMKDLCGTFATITEISDSGITLEGLPSKYTRGYIFTEKMLKPATDEPKFKIGDVVKILNSANYYVGKVGEVKAHHKGIDNSNHYLVELRAESCWYQEQDLELYVEPKCKFKVGDKVVVYKGKKVGIVEFVPTIHDDLYKVGFMDGDCDFFAEENMTPYTEPRWTFTDDEKVILRNLPKEYKWIARDKDGILYIITDKPKKTRTNWNAHNGDFIFTDFYSHLFQSIKWEDEEPCEFRKYL